MRGFQVSSTSYSAVFASEQTIVMPAKTQHARYTCAHITPYLYCTLRMCTCTDECIYIHLYIENHFFRLDIYLCLSVYPSGDPRSTHKVRLITPDSKKSFHSRTSARLILCVPTFQATHRESPQKPSPPVIQSVATSFFHLHRYSPRHLHTLLGYRRFFCLLPFSPSIDTRPHIRRELGYNRTDCKEGAQLAYVRIPR